MKTGEGGRSSLSSESGLTPNKDHDLRNGSGYRSRNENSRPRGNNPFGDKRREGGQQGHGSAPFRRSHEGGSKGNTPETKALPKREKAPKKPVTVDESGWQEVAADSVIAAKRDVPEVSPEREGGRE